jgi:hypothetical protein
LRFPRDRLRSRPAGWALLLAFAVVLGGALRFTGLDWDDGAHLHPDERYLTMVADAVEWPGSAAGYLDVGSSPLSPYNTEQGRDYLYGQLPLFAAKLTAGAVGRDTYDGLPLVGRALSALLDTLTIVTVFLIARLVVPSSARPSRELLAALAALFYAATVTAIQHAHFFTTESWLVAATAGTFLLAGSLVSAPGPGGLPLLRLGALGAAAGVTAATKPSGLLVLVPVAIAAASVVLRRRDDTLGKLAGGLGLAGLAVLAGCYVAYRLVSPYAFEHSNWLYLEPSEDFRSALEAQRAAIDGDFLYPPAYQWLLSEPWIDPLRNLVRWGLGVPLGLTALAGMAVLTGRLVALRLRELRLEGGVVRLMLVAFVAVTFAWFASRFAHAVRYLLPIVPFLCVAAAVAVGALYRRSALAGQAAAVGVGLATILYACAFVSIYRAPNTRVAASAWLEANARAGSTIVGEHWDDGLPLRPEPGRYRLGQLPVFDPDDGKKLRKLFDGLAKADYYVLSSPRAWRTIGRLPERFPIMTRFYELLQGGRLGFREVASFESQPRLLGFEVRDLDAEEPFWVYDHPPVLVYERAGPLRWDRFRDALCADAALPGCS